MRWRSAQALNIRVINLSVAAGVYESYNADPLTLAAKSAVRAGIVVVAAAGNIGRSVDGHTQYGGITAPANAPWVLTVGASSHMGTVDRSDDTIATFTSRGPTAVDALAKPDIVAPGVGIESLAAPGSASVHLRGGVPAERHRPDRVSSVSQSFGDQRSRARRDRDDRADAAGEPRADAERRQGDSAIHLRNLSLLRPVDGRGRLPQREGRRGVGALPDRPGDRVVSRFDRLGEAADLGQSSGEGGPTGGRRQRVGDRRHMGRDDDARRRDDLVGRRREVADRQGDRAQRRLGHHLRRRRLYRPRGHSTP